MIKNYDTPCDSMFCDNVRSFAKHAFANSTIVLCVAVGFGQGCCKSAGQADEITFSSEYQMMSEDEEFPKGIYETYGNHIMLDIKDPDIMRVNNVCTNLLNTGMPDVVNYVAVYAWVYNSNPSHVYIMYDDPVWLDGGPERAIFVYDKDSRVIIKSITMSVQE